MSLTPDQIVTLTEILVVLMGIGITWAVYHGSDRAELPGDGDDPGSARSGRRAPRHPREDAVMGAEFDCGAACPFLAERPQALDFPVGQVRRVASGGEDTDVDETRRNILKLAGVGALVLAGGGLGAAAIQYAQPPVVGLTSYPKVQLIRRVGQTPHRHHRGERVQRRDERPFSVQLPAPERAELPPEPGPRERAGSLLLEPGEVERAPRGRHEWLDRCVQRDLPASWLPCPGHRLLSARHVPEDVQRRTAPVLHPLLLSRVDV